MGAATDAAERRGVQSSIPTLVAFAPVFGLAAAQGGYFPTAWGWATLPLLWISVLALVLRSQLCLTGAEVLFCGLLAGLTAWIALSTAWSAAPSETILEFQRALVYLSGAAALFLVSRREDAGRVLAGLLAAIALIAAFALATRLVPDRISVSERTPVYRLAQPIGYWNGLAVFTAMGAILALGFAGRGRLLRLRALSAVCLVVLLPTFYFTFGRAGWLALAFGLVVALAIDPRRLQLLTTLLVLAPSVVIALWLSVHSPGLTRSGASSALAVHDGHRLGIALALVATAAAGTASLLGFAERRLAVSATTRRVFAAGVVACVIGGLLAAFVHFGSPVTLARKGYAAFKAPPPHVVNLNRRLLSFSGNGRYELWRLAWVDARHHPWLGSGAGTYERFFLRRQPANVGRVRDAHGLYVETLAELGPAGLALVLSALAVPLVVAVRARRHPHVPAATGAYAAFLAHAMVDWDWELAAVTLAAILCAGAILLAGRAHGALHRASTPVRGMAAGAAVVVACVATVGLIGNSALKASTAAARHGEWTHAAAAARRARGWMPWSPAPWAALGQAQLDAGLIREARMSFRKAVSMDKDDWELWYDLARASSGQPRADALQRAALLYPRSGLLARSQH
jgi:hypothetical protein